MKSLIPKIIMKKMIKEYGGKEKYASKSAKAKHEKKESKKTEMKEKKCSKCGKKPCKCGK